MQLDSHTKETKGRGAKGLLEDLPLAALHGQAGLDEWRRSWEELGGVEKDNEGLVRPSRWKKSNDNSNSNNSINRNISNNSNNSDNKGGKLKMVEKSNLSVSLGLWYKMAAHGLHLIHN